MNAIRTKLTAVLLNLSLSAASLASLAIVAHADQELSTVGSQWAVYEQNTLPNGNLHFYPAAHATTIPSGGVQFPMPDATGDEPTFVNYMLDTYTVALTEVSTITATIKVVPTEGLPVFLGDTFGGINLATPAFVRLFVEANLPADGSATCVGGHANVNNYWWADAAFYTFTPDGSGGTITLTAPLNPTQWSGICGNPGSADPASFDLAIANIKNVGLSFGSGYFFASGVGVDGATGSANFQLISYTVSP